MQVSVASVQSQRAEMDGLAERARQAVLRAFMPTDPKLADDKRMQDLVGAAADVVLEFMNIIAALNARGPLHYVPAIMALSVGLPNNPFWRENQQYLTPVMVSCQMSVLEAVRLVNVAGNVRRDSDEALQSALKGSWLVFVTSVAIALYGPKWAIDNTLMLKRDLIEIL